MSLDVDQLVLADGRRISYIRLAPSSQAEMNSGPAKAELMWLGGFRSEMRGGKADALHKWCAARGLGFTRFDYSGHGETGGDFENCTITQWLEESEAVFTRLTQGPVIFIGSSMGAWLALLLMKRLGGDRAGRIKGAVLIAPAWDMTERLMWGPAPQEIKDEIMQKGVWHRPSAYDDVPYPITLKLIEDGRKHLIGGVQVLTRTRQCAFCTGSGTLMCRGRDRLSWRVFCKMMMCASRSLKTPSTGLAGTAIWRF